MWGDAWNDWLQKWRKAPARRVSQRRAGSQTESLEERALLGELVPSTLPAVASSFANLEVAGLSTTTLPTESVAQTSPLVVQSAPTSVARPDSTASDETTSVQPLSATSTDTSSSKVETLGLQLKNAKSASAKSQLKATHAEQRAASRAARKAAKADQASSRPPTNTTTGSTASSTPSSTGISTDPDTESASSAATTSNSGAAVPGLGLSLPNSVNSPTTATNNSSPILTADKPESLASAVFVGDPQLSTTDVEQLLDRASAATPSKNAIIVIVDRQGIILGVRVEEDVPTADVDKLIFSIDGAVAKARTAAYFSNDQGVLTSRTVRFISQTTITEREVESNPSITDMSSTLAGPGFVAPIGLGGHFPPDIMHTPPVDLFAIEHSNRDSIDSYPGGEGRFNADYASAAKEINAPGSYGLQSGLDMDAQPRGIATLPGGLPIYRNAKGNDNTGDTLIGGIGVFFPGPDGYATYEQGFVHGDGKSTTARTNAPLVEEAELIALTAIGSSVQAGIKATPVGGIPPVTGIDLPFPRIDLVGITLEAIGPTAGIEGVRQIKQLGARLGQGTVNGDDQIVAPEEILPDGTIVSAPTLQEGTAVPTGWLVAAHDGVGLTAADVTKIIMQGITEAKRVRAAIRVPLGSRTRMVFAVTDTTGEVLGLYRMDDATYFSLDVAVAKARNMAYYDDPTALKPEDRVIPKQNPLVNPRGVAFTARTFRFLVEPRYPSGVDGTKPGQFSILNEPSINRKNAENIEVGGVEIVAPASSFQTAQGYDSFNIGTNFHEDKSDNQNGVVFFPGSSGVYKNGVLVGGLGVSGDGVDQDDVVTTAAIVGFAPPTSIRADQFTYRNVRLPYNKFLRNPYG